MTVLLAGLPHSGNHLVTRQLQRHGMEVRGIFHFGRWPEGYRGIEAVVIPVREAWPNWRGCGGQTMPIPSPRDMIGQDGPYDPVASSFRTPAHMHYAHWLPTLQRAAAMGVPIYPVSYEEIVADKNAASEKLLRLVGREGKGWQEEVFDGNAER